MMRKIFLEKFGFSVGWSILMGVFCLAAMSESVPPLEEYKDSVKIAAVQMVIEEEFLQEHDSVDALIPYMERAQQDQVDLLVFPEYLLGNFKIPDPLTDKLCAEANKHNLNVIVGGWEYLPGEEFSHPPKEGTFSNTGLVVSREGKIVGKHRKMHPACGAKSPYDWPPEENEVSEILMKLGEEPTVVDLDFGRIGLLTCYDGYFFPTFEIPSLKGAEILVWINGRGGAIEDYIVKTASFMTCTHVVATNQSMGAGTMICAYPANIVENVTKPGEAYISSTLDLQFLRGQRKNNRMFHQRRPSAYKDLVKEWEPWEAYPFIEPFRYPESQ
ncbi:MAG: carbon-nitrogen hydrolase family protein [Candidatus Omnitrophica bacterium]|nr:carbon-nitrogen hydrolase family protein [Candidatus Omnitrophota bacterium]